MVVSVALAGSCLISRGACADVQLPALFSDNMVLQRNVSVPVWGTGDVGEAVTVAIGGQHLSTIGDENGRWRVTLAPMRAGDAAEMKVMGKNTLTVHNIAIGEVWVCSGQSNMTFPVESSADAPKEIANANYPQIRLFTVKREAADEPASDVSGNWKVCSPQTVGNFAAVGYFFGRDLYKALRDWNEERGVPIGLIHSSWPGTPPAAWTSLSVLLGDPQLKPILTLWHKSMARYPVARQEYGKSLVDWQAATTKAKAAGAALPRKPREPEGPDSFQRPACLYNGMISPLIPYGIKGVVWYQGESNVGQAQLYQKLFPALIQNWRHDWSEGAFPFFFVQLTKRQQRESHPMESAWAELREAQQAALALPHTGMAVTTDINEPAIQHPINKQVVGHRLALVALATEYGQRVECSGPICHSMTVEGHKIRLHFKHTQNGLLAYEGDIAKSFQLVPADSWTYKAMNRIMESGIIEGFNPNPFSAGGLKRRWEFAAALKSQLMSQLIMLQMSKGGAPGPSGPPDAANEYRALKNLLLSLEREFADELTLLKAPLNKGVLPQNVSAPTLKGFAIAGADKKFIWAQARIEGDTVLVWSDQIVQPVAVRYAWADNPIGNLYNAAGLPAAPFRTDKWTTAGEKK